MNYLYFSNMSKSAAKHFSFRLTVQRYGLLTSHEIEREAIRSHSETFGGFFGTLFGEIGSR